MERVRIRLINRKSAHRMEKANFSNERNLIIITHLHEIFHKDERRLMKGRARVLADGCVRDDTAKSKRITLSLW